MQRKRYRQKNGSMMVEAAIVLPVFIIAVVTLCWFIKACFLEAAVFSTAVDQIHTHSVSLTGTAGMQHSIREALEESGIEGSEFDQKRLETGITVEGEDDFKKLIYSYDTKIRIPLPFVSRIDLKNEILFHMWDGTENEGTPFSFSDMERDGDGVPVLVFPRSGGKYHSSSCRYTSAYPTEVTLTAELRRKYGRCVLCTEGDETDGERVYIFQYGGCYHEKDCSSIDKYTETIDREDAVKKGYTACSICGGGE